MTTITINVDKGFDAYSIADTIRKVRGVGKVKIQDAEQSERIPGLPYTHEERVASVRDAMADYRAGGRTYTTEELRERMAKW